MFFIHLIVFRKTNFHLTNHHELRCYISKYDVSIMYRIKYSIKFRFLTTYYGSSFQILYSFRIVQFHILKKKNKWKE